jgi:hypothetical protein
MKELILAALSIGSGYRTYVVAAALVLNAAVPVLSGDMALGDVDYRGILEGLGLVTLRAGMR